VGYDNWEVFATTGRPPLTTIDMCLNELGQQAARRLLASIDGQAFSGVEQLPCRLVIRESTGASRP
jgi:LacI family transcriptional regulator